MKLNKLLIVGATTLTIGTAITGAALPVSAQANTSSETVINERWGKPTFVAGAGLSESQLQETMNIFKINQNDVTIDKSTGADLVKYLGYGSGDDSVMFSSVLVNREDPGKGINVKILTPENITTITADQYKNPLITAGVKDATVQVASVVKVTGESALTGVYKAFQANGEEIDPERAKVAQDELNTTKEVSDSIVNNANTANNQNETLTSSEQETADEAYKTQLNQVLVDIKKQLAELKDQTGQLATKEDVEKIVNDALAKHNLSDYVSEEDISKLVNLADKFQNTDGVLDQESLDQLDQIGKEFKDTVNNLGNKLNDLGVNLDGFSEDLNKTVEENKGFFAQLFESIKEFFTNLFNSNK